MTANEISRAEILDITFENRNKLYGAYALRKTYSKRLFRSLIVSIFFTLGALFSIFFYRSTTTNPGYDLETITTSLPPNFENSKKINNHQPLRTKPKAKKGKVYGVATSFQVGNENSIEQNISNVGATNDFSEGPSTEEKFSTLTTGRLQSSSIENRPDDSPLMSPDLMPSFPGGVEELMRFLEKHLRNPAQLEELSMIIVKISFVVGPDGKLSGFEIIEDGGDIFNNEVIRVLKKMPLWIPGRIALKAVPVRYILPVKFIVGE